MRKLTVFLVLATLVISTTAFAAATPFSGSWDKVYDFEDGVQGWALHTENTNGGGVWEATTTATWVAPGTRPQLPAAVGFSHQGALGGNLHLPDRGVAMISAQDVAGKASLGSFVYQVDVYIPNMWSLVGNFPGTLPGNFNQRAGLTAYRQGDNACMNLFGRPDSSGRMWFKDRAWDNADRWTDGSVADGGTIGANWGWVDDDNTKPIEDWWNDWITLQIDYNYSTPGKVAAWVYKPWNTPQSGWAAGWAKVCEVDTNAAANNQWSTFAIGDRIYSGDDSWTQSQFDNVKFKYTPVPEPSSMLALATGLFGMAGFAVRRRK